METVADFSFLGSKITADGDCSHEIKRHLRLGRKVMTNLDSILKSRDTTLSTKVHLVKAMVFPVVMMWELDDKESWALKNWCFWTVVWRRLLRIPWTTRRSNQSILKEISPEYSLKGLMLKLKLQYLAIWWEELTHLKKCWCSERLTAGGEEDDKGWDGWMASLTQWTWVWVNYGSWWWTGWPGVLWFMGSQRVRHDWVTELNWMWLQRLQNLKWSNFTCLPIKERRSMYNQEETREISMDLQKQCETVSGQLTLYGAEASPK